MKKRCWWSRLRTEGVGLKLVAAEAGEEEKVLLLWEADARKVVFTGAKRSAT